jgi:hypothetical protein
MLPPSTASSTDASFRITPRTILDLLGYAFEANSVLGGSTTLAPKAISDLRAMAERI